MPDDLPNATRAAQGYAKQAADAALSCEVEYTYLLTALTAAHLAGVRWAVEAAAKVADEYEPSERGYKLADRFVKAAWDIACEEIAAAIRRLAP